MPTPFREATERGLPERATITEQRAERLSFPGMDRPTGLIAGGGRLPILTADGIRAAGGRVACVGLAGECDPALRGHCDRFARAGIARLGRWIRLLKGWGVREAVMVGGVRKAQMYDPLAVLRRVPDLRAARLWFATARGDRRNDALLGAVAEALAQEGVTLIDSTRYVREHLAEAGVLTARAPSAQQRRDADFGYRLARRMGELDVGQSVAVRDGETIAVEAIEGTAAMIERAGRLCPRGGWTLVKAAKPAQDRRFDVPTVGEETIDQLKAAGAGCLAVEAGEAIVLQKPRVIERADAAGIAVLGVGAPEAEAAP